MRPSIPRALLVALLASSPALAGCPTEPDDDDTGSAGDDDSTGDDDDTTDDERVDQDWGVVDECDAPASPGFGDWYQAGRGILVYGTTAEDLDAAFVSELGMTTAEVEAAWLASIE